MPVSDFPVGSIVRLKSGGPLLSVTGAQRRDQDSANDMRGDISVSWFDDEGHAQSHTFPEECLLVDRTPPVRPSPLPGPW